MRDLYFFGATKRVCTVAAVPGRFVFALSGLRFFRWCGSVLVPEHCACLFRVPSPHQPFRHRMQCGLKSLAVRLAQRFTHGAVDDSVQFIDIHFDPPA